MGFDDMGYIKRLSFAMTDPNYLVIPRMKNHYGALVTDRLSPCLDDVNEISRNQRLGQITAVTCWRKDWAVTSCRAPGGGS
jgi:hypothetical protein